MINIKSSLTQIQSERQVSFSSGDRICVNGDKRYTGTLIRPIEKTNPTRWTVEFDDGYYETVIVDQLCLITPIGEENTEDKSNLTAFEKEIYETEIKLLKQEIIALKQKNQELKEELKKAQQIIRHAKDISPVVRPSLKRVVRLAHNACMEVKRTVGGWILQMGHLARKFRRLGDIWLLLSQDNWCLSEIFRSDKLIPIDQIQPPSPRKKPIHNHIFPASIKPDLIKLLRKMGLPAPDYDLENIY